MDLAKLVFNDLLYPKLFHLCFGGETKNNNEYLNSLIWKLGFKTRVGKRIIDIATSEAVIIFNELNKGRIKSDS